MIHVAGIQPAAVEHGFGGLFWIIPILGRGRPAPHMQRADVALRDWTIVVANDADFISPDHPARGAGLIIGGRVADEYMKRLGGAQTINDQGAGFFLPAHHHITRQRFTRRHTLTQRTGIPHFFIQCVQLLRIKRRHAEEYRRAVFLEYVEGHVGGDFLIA